MHLAPFEGPRLKIARGLQHVAELKVLVTEYGKRARVAAGPCTLEKPASPDLAVWRLYVPEPSPPEVPLMLGDAAHNFRSALDMMIGDLVELRQVKVARARYPFGLDATAVLATYDKNLKRLGSDIRDAILATRPYKNGNSLLRGLHDLDVNDKHEWVTPTYYAIPAALYVPEPARINMKALVGIDPGEPRLIRIGSTVHVQTGADSRSYVQTVDGKLIPTFGPDSPYFADQPFVETLENIGKLTNEIVALFADKFGSSGVTKPEPIPPAPPEGELPAGAAYAFFNGAL